MKIRLSVLLLFLSIVSFGQKKDIQVHNTEKYFIEYPKSWSFELSENPSVEFILKTKEQKTDPFRENITLVIQDLKEKDMSLEEYIELTESQLRNMMKGSIVSENMYDKIKKRHVLVYSVNVSSAYLKVKQHFYKKGNQIYILTFTALKKSFEDYKRAADTVLNSFVFKPNK
ncbi:PsbP-related protein [Tenacibaculum sp. 190524A05c]|uniref:PsbP-related protein n=1 Tax=Tenacibaculum platacis TaxID=3137852 RepID=UPI0032B116EC